jgi:hypothetical protein
MAVADQFLDLEIDEIGRMLAVGNHHLGRRASARGFVGFERRARVGVGRQQIGQRARVDRRLRRAIGAARIHRMGGIAGQRDAAEGPGADRVLIDHGIFQDLIGIADHLRHVQPVEPPAFIEREKNRPNCRAGSSRSVRTCRV